MRKILSSALCIFMACLFLTVPAFAARKNSANEFIPSNYELIMADKSVTAIKNGEFSTLSAPAQDVGGTFMIPVRYFFEAYGYEVLWDNGKTTLSGEKQITVEQGNNVVTVDGEEVTLKEAVSNIDGTLYIPQDICTVLGKNYKYSANGLFVIFTGDYSVSYDMNLIRLQGIYMAEDGKSSATGTPRDPISTLAGARDKAIEHIKVYGSSYPVNIFVKGGNYKVYETVTFEPLYFGDVANKGVNFKGYNGKAVFSGATQLDTELLTPVTDPLILAKLPKGGRGKVAYIDLNAIGLGDYVSTANGTAFNYVYVDDKQMTHSRWPNDDYSLVSSIPVAKEFCYEGINPARWTQADDLYICGFFTADYAYGVQKAESVDVAAGRIRTSGNGFSTSRAGARWFAKNLLEEVDAPGEWYVDRTNKILYIYPPYTMKDAKLELSLMKDYVMQMKSCINISFDNLTFEKFSNRVISCDNIKGFSLTNCDFKFIQNDFSVRGWGIDDITVRGNFTYSCEKGFASLRAGDVKNIKASKGMKYDNNRHVLMGGDGGNIMGVLSGGYNSPEGSGSANVTIENNLFQDCNATYAISIPGVNVYTRYNEIMNQARGIKDGGAIYTGRSFSYRGNEIAYNYVHHINKDHFFCGLYNDDGYSGADWHHNIVYSANRSTIIGLGSDMKFRYNLCIDCENSGTVGTRMTWSAGTYGPGGKFEQERDRVLAYPGGEYAELFPELELSKTRDPYFAPWDVVIFGNVGINNNGTVGAYGTRDEIEKYGAKTIIRGDGKEQDISAINSTKEGNPNYVYSDDYFVDASKQNWNLKPDSQVAKDFPELLEIDVNKIGLTDEYAHLLTKDDNDSFRQSYPHNGAVGVQAKEVRFSWTPLMGATQYRIVVATDPQLQNVVIDHTQMENGITNAYTTTLDLDTVYYWKVYGISVARQDQWEKPSEGAPFGFKTAAKNEVDKENFKLALDALTALMDEITTKGYKYEEEFMTMANDLLARSSDAYKNATEQEQLDTLEEDIYNLIERSPFYMIVEFKTPSFLTNPAEWTCSATGSVAYDGTTVTVNGNGARTNAVVNTDTADSILCMQIQYGDTSDGGGFQGLDYKMAPASSNSYLFIVKKAVLEFQKEGKFFMELPNFMVEGKKWYNYQLGAVNCAGGGVLQYVSIDGNLVFAALDQTPTKVLTGGRFRVRSNAVDTISMKPMETLPEPKSLMAAIYESWSNPLNEDHLQTMLTGAFSTMELETPMYSALDKDKLASLIYPKLQSGEIAKIQGTDFKAFKNEIKKWSVLAAYNQGLGEHLFQNNVKLIYGDITNFKEKIDNNGVTLCKFAEERLADKDFNMVNNATLNGNCKDFDELAKRYAKSIFTTSMNIAASTFAADYTYIADVVTKENMAYFGVNLDDYFALNDNQKTYVHNIVGYAGNASRTFDEIIEAIHKASAEAK